MLSRQGFSARLNVTYKYILTLFYFLSSFTPLLASEVNGVITIGGRSFFDDAESTDQSNLEASIKLEGELRHKWDGNNIVFSFIPFYREDQQDPERSHADIRRFDITIGQGDWEYQLGVSKVFWGVIESAHLVDIVNQTDFVENLDGEDKLGQPLVRARRFFDSGSIDFILLPYFRERTFASSAGRLRQQLIVDSQDIRYESLKKQKHIDYVIRYQPSLDWLDFAVYYFRGTSREPDFTPDFDNGLLKQFYPQISQVAIEMQYIQEDWLWKLESIKREFKKGSFHAQVGGFEFTIPRIFESYSDLGLIMEYHRDSRADTQIVAFQNDLFLGTRLVQNDFDSSEYLFGIFLDLDNQSKSFNLQYSSRLSKLTKFNVEAQFFLDIDPDDLFYSYERDNHISLELEYYY